MSRRNRNIQRTQTTKNINTAASNAKVPSDIQENSRIADEQNSTVKTAEAEINRVSDSSAVSNSVIIPQESERIQRAEWIHEQVKRQREMEDEAWEKIMEEQKLLTERRRSIDEDINRNRELKRYHEGCMEDITDQVYSLHGISVDKLEGIKEYKNALFRGEAVIVFGISVILAALAAYAYGPTSQLCLFMLMCIGAEGALLSRKKRSILYFVPLILIAAEMISYKMYPQYLEYVTMAGEAIALLLVVLGTVGYFTQNPYRKDKKNIRAAKSDLKELHKVARKSVKKNQKVRVKSEAKEAKRTAKQAKKDAKAVIKEQKRQNKLARKQAKYELKEKKRQQKSERVELKHELKKSQLMDKVRKFTPKAQDADNIIDIDRKVN